MDRVTSFISVRWVTFETKLKYIVKYQNTEQTEPAKNSHLPFLV